MKKRLYINASFFNNYLKYPWRFRMKLNYLSFNSSEIASLAGAASLKLTKNHTQTEVFFHFSRGIKNSGYVISPAFLKLINNS
jgi:hypothetical protein